MKTNNPEEERESIERALSERLEAHDKSRKAAQDKLGEVCKELETNVSELENRISSELEEKSTAESNRLQSALDDLQMDGGDALKAVQRAKAELLVMESYDVVESSANEDISAFDVSSLYELKTEKKRCAEKLGAEKEHEKIERTLNMRIEMHDESRRAAQDRLHELCEGLRAQVADLKSRINKELENKFTAEDKRLQTALSELRSDEHHEDAPKILQRAKAELLVVQSYEVVLCNTKGRNGDEPYFDL